MRRLHPKELVIRTKVSTFGNYEFKLQKFTAWTLKVRDNCRKRKTHNPKMSLPPKTWIVLTTGLSAEDNVVSDANIARRMLFYLKRSFAAVTPSIFLPLYKTFIRPHLEYAIRATHPILCRDAEALEKVQKLALKFVEGLRHVPYEGPRKQLRLFSLTHRRIIGDLIAIFKIFLLEFPMVPTFAHPTRNRPRLQVPPAEMFHAPSPIRLHNLGCPILEQTAGWDSQRIISEIFQDTPGHLLAVPVPRSTHITHLLSQPVPSAHIDPRKKLTLKWPFPYTNTTPWSFIVVFTAP